jgi:hypothetical protein
MSFLHLSFWHYFLREGGRKKKEESNYSFVVAGCLFHCNPSWKTHFYDYYYIQEKILIFYVIVMINTTKTRIRKDKILMYK